MEPLPKTVITFEFTGDLELLRNELTIKSIGLAASTASGRYVVEEVSVRLFRVEGTNRYQLYPKTFTTDPPESLRKVPWRAAWQNQFRGTLRALLMTTDNSIVVLN